MRVTVRLFARLRDLAGAADLDRELPDGATALALWDGLAADFPDFEPYQATVSVAVNEEYARMDVALADGDDIAFLPPVSGG